MTKRPNTLTIFGTGIRPDKIGSYDWNAPIMNKAKKEVLNKLIEVLNQFKGKVETFRIITGGALGFDQILFEASWFLKQKYSNLKIQLEIAVPYKDQPNNWFHEGDKERYFSQIERADSVVYVDELLEYNPSPTDSGTHAVWKLQKRNEYMVDESDLGISLWNHTKGGTYNCLLYAQKEDVPFIIIDWG